MDLMQALNVSSGGMAAQSVRMRMIAENVANADSVMTESGEAYRKQKIYFKAELDRATGITHVKVDGVRPDTVTPFKYIYEPGHEFANEKGLVAYPNVNKLEENINMREASRSYEANMQAIEVSKEMMVRSLDLLR